MIKKNRPFQDIFTPRVMVDEMMVYCNIQDGDTVLDPCVGSGNLIIPILEKYNVQVTAVEIQQQHIYTLVERLKDMDVEVEIYKVKSLYSDEFF